MDRRKLFGLIGLLVLVCFIILIVAMGRGCRLDDPIPDYDDAVQDDGAPDDPTPSYAVRLLPVEAPVVAS